MYWIPALPDNPATKIQKTTHDNTINNVAKVQTSSGYLSEIFSITEI